MYHILWAGRVMKPSDVVTIEEREFFWKEDLSPAILLSMFMKPLICIIGDAKVKGLVLSEPIGLPLLLNRMY
jgi:hypothetical protein